MSLAKAGAGGAAPLQQQTSSDSRLGDGAANRPISQPTGGSLLWFIVLWFPWNSRLAMNLWDLGVWNVHMINLKSCLCGLHSSSWRAVLYKKRETVFLFRALCRIRARFWKWKFWCCISAKGSLCCEGLFNSRRTVGALLPSVQAFSPPMCCTQLSENEETPLPFISPLPGNLFLDLFILSLGQNSHFPMTTSIPLTGLSGSWLWGVYSEIVWVEVCWEVHMGRFPIFPNGECPWPGETEARGPRALLPAAHHPLLFLMAPSQRAYLKVRAWLGRSRPRRALWTAFSSQAENRIGETQHSPLGLSFWNPGFHPAHPSDRFLVFILWFCTVCYIFKLFSEIEEWVSLKSKQRKFASWVKSLGVDWTLYSFAGGSIGIEKWRPSFTPARLCRNTDSVNLWKPNSGCACSAVVHAPDGLCAFCLILTVVVGCMGGGGSWFTDEETQGFIQVVISKG